MVRGYIKLYRTRPQKHGGYMYITEVQKSEKIRLSCTDRAEQWTVGDQAIRLWSDDLQPHQSRTLKIILHAVQNKRIKRARRKAPKAMKNTETCFKWNFDAVEQGEQYTFDYHTSKLAMAALLFLYQHCINTCRFQLEENQSCQMLFLRIAPIHFVFSLRVNLFFFAKFVLISANATKTWLGSQRWKLWCRHWKFLKKAFKNLNSSWRNKYKKQRSDRCLSCSY